MVSARVRPANTCDVQNDLSFSALDGRQETARIRHAPSKNCATTETGGSKRAVKQKA
jgi:hypothetical protein